MRARCDVRNDRFQRCTRALGHDGEHRAGSRGTTLRNLRVAEDLWRRAQAVAEARGESLSDVMRGALERYVKRHEPR